jgi:putative transposase
MPNHFHFLICQDGDQPAGLLSQRVFNSYSKAYNKRYQHSGTLFEGPYRVRMVTQTPDLLHLCCYIQANPVKDGFAADPGDWPYSNYLEWVGERKGDLVDRDFVNLHFGKPGGYVELVNDYIQNRKKSSIEAEYFEEFEE